MMKNPAAFYYLLGALLLFSAPFISLLIAHRDPFGKYLALLACAIIVIGIESQTTFKTQ